MGTGAKEEQVDSEAHLHQIYLVSGYVNNGYACLQDHKAFYQIL